MQNELRKHNERSLAERMRVDFPVALKPGLLPDYPGCKKSKMI